MGCPPPHSRVHRVAAPSTPRPGDVAKLPTQPGHFWLLDTFVRGHQIGHWAETLAFFHAIHLQERSYGLPPLRRLLINKLDPPLSDHERFIYDIAMRSLTYPVEAPLWCVCRTGGARAHGACAHAPSFGHVERGTQAVPAERAVQRALLRADDDVVHHRGGASRRRTPAGGTPAYLGPAPSLFAPGLRRQQTARTRACTAYTPLSG